MMANKYSPIGVFDSGMGGVSVLRELVVLLPNEDYIYYGDSAHAPYGEKTLEEVRTLTIAHAQELMAEGIKGRVVACITATSAAVRFLRGLYPDLPLVGIEPALKPAALSAPHPRVLVLATPMTIREEKFQALMARYSDRAEVLPLPCPGLMEFIERGDLEGEDLRMYLQELLAPYRGQVDAAVLGCTHYPFVRGMIAEILGPEVAIYDGGAGTARQMKHLLAEADLLNPRTTPGSVDFRNSASQEMADRSRRLFELP